MFDDNRSNLSKHINNFSAALKSQNPLCVFDPSVVSDAISHLDLEYRERIFGPFMTLWAFLLQCLDVDKSCKNAVAQLLAFRKSNGLPLISIGTGGYCLARSRLPLDFFIRVAQSIADRLSSATDQNWLWMGSKVKVVDGTTISICDTKKNAAEFPKLSLQKNGVGFPLVRTLGIFSLSTGVLQNLAIGGCKGKGTGEQTLLNRLWGSFSEGETLLGDALFSSFTILVSAKTRGVKVVTELKKSRGQKLKGRSTDRLIHLDKPKHKPEYLSEKEFLEMPMSILVRILTITIAPKGFRPKKKYILTTYVDKKAISSDNIKELYRRRWAVEINIRYLKTQMGMEIINAKSPDMVKKTIWVYMIAYNLVRTFMITAAVKYDRIPSELSFETTIKLLRAFRGNGQVTKGDLSTIITAIAACRVGNRGERYEPRALKRRRKPYSNLMESRPLAKSRLYKRAKAKKKL